MANAFKALTAKHGWPKRECGRTVREEGTYYRESVIPSTNPFNRSLDGHQTINIPIAISQQPPPERRS
jgi:hypothetical protein